MALPPSAEAAGRRLVFLHLPKTGGTTLHHHFAEHFAPEEICPERFSSLDRFTTEELSRWRYFSGHYNFDQLRLIPGPLFVVTVLRDPVERLLSNYYFWKRHRPAVIAAKKLDGPATAREGTLLDFLRSKNHAALDATDNTMTRYLAGQINIWQDGTLRFNSGCGAITVSELEVLHRAMGNLLSVDVFGVTARLGEVYTRVAHVFGMKRVMQLARLNTREDSTPDLEPVVEEAITPEIGKELDRCVRLDRVLFRLARLHLHKVVR
jgi:hypothetical protein